MLFRSLRRSADAFPARGAYLSAPSVLVAEYTARLAALGPGPKIGIAWRGGLPETMGALRSMPHAALAPFTAVPGVHYVSLEFADCTAEIEAFSLAATASNCRAQEVSPCDTCRWSPTRCRKGSWPMKGWPQRTASP